MKRDLTASRDTRGVTPDRTRTWLLAAVPIVLLFSLYAVFLLQKVFFVSSDLGRHLRNGEILVKHGMDGVITTNYYSSTAAAFPALNHHWATGVVFYFGWKAFGFAGLHALFVGLRLFALWLFFDIARRRAGIGLASLAGVLLVIVLAERVEIRPEIFSYLFCGLFYWLLTRVRRHEISWRWLWLLPAIEAAWVNLHIYFFLGPAIVGAFLCEALFRRDGQRRAFGTVLVGALAATVLNPFGVQGALAPLTIFHNYGLEIAENQPVWFMVHRVGGITYVMFCIVAPLLAISVIAAAWKEHPRVAWRDVLLASGVTAMGFLAIRNLTLFALFALPLLAGNAATLLGARAAAYERRSRALAIASLMTLAVLVATQDPKRVKYWNAGEFGLGIETGNQAAAEFFRAHRLRGPVFNNYDIGGYLIHHLWPDVRVFVDNRPEAYPAEFFREVYWPMLKEPSVWAKREKEFGFNTIFFAHTDMSPAAQRFLIERMRDAEWAVVFCDAWNVLFVRRNQQNAELIARLPAQR